jgi:hypothetical protein
MHGPLHDVHAFQTSGAVDMADFPYLPFDFRIAKERDHLLPCAQLPHPPCGLHEFVLSKLGTDRQKGLGVDLQKREGKLRFDFRLFGSVI